MTAWAKILFAVWVIHRPGKAVTITCGNESCYVQSCPTDGGVCRAENLVVHNGESRFRHVQRALKDGGI